MMIHDDLEATAQRFPDKDAIQCGNRVVSFGSLSRESNRLGRVLRELGMTRSDRVAIVAENSIEYMIAHWGILKSGGTIVPIPPDSTHESLRFMLNNCTAAYAVIQERLLTSVLPALRAVDSVRAILCCGERSNRQHARPNAQVPILDMAEACAAQTAEPLDFRSSASDTALVMYTSGSTGKPKGVMMSHRNLEVAVESMMQYLGFSDSDVELTALPMTHTFGLRRVHCYTRAGGRVILEGNLRDPRRLLEHLARERVTTLPATPAMLGMFLNAYEEDFARCCRDLRYIMINSAPMPPLRVQRLLEVLPRTEVYMYYGLAEAGRCSYIKYRDDPSKIASVGRAGPNVDIRVLDEKMLEVPPNTEGEVVVWGPGVMQGYWNEPDATRAVLTGVGLRTGDLGYLDDDGFLYITGRIKDLINVDGLKASPQEIENVVLSVAGVRDAAAVPQPHPLLGEAVKVFVVREPGSTVEASRIIAACRAALEAYKVPREVSFCDEIPKTGSGKTQRFVLRESSPGATSHAE